MPRRSDAAKGLADEEIARFVSRANLRHTALESLPALSAWQRKMEQYPQLSPQAQNELVLEFQAGIAADQELRGMKRASGARERKLRATIRRGQYAGEMLAGSNFRLVLLIAREKAVERHGKERAVKVLPDLVGEANLALTEAASSFDATRGPSFPTYLAKVIRDRMIAVLERKHAIKLPPSWARVKRIYSVRMPKLTEELGREPSMDEMKADLVRVCLEWAEGKLTPDELLLPRSEREQAMHRRLLKQGMLGAISHLEDLLSVSATLSSTDAPLSEGGGTVGDLLSNNDPDAATVIEHEEMAEAVREALDSLPDRDREIVLYRYGFIDGECWTYQKISAQYGVSAERIRQIEHAVIERMRLPHEQFSKLAGFLNPSE